MFLASTCASYAAQDSVATSSPFQYQFYHTNAHTSGQFARTDCNAATMGGCVRNLPGEGRDIIGDVLSPYHMFGKSMVMYSPTDREAALSYHMKSTTIFVYSDNEYGLAYNTFGFATSSFGVSFLFANDYTWQNFEVNSPYDKSETDIYSGDNSNYYALSFAMPIGGLDIQTRMLYAPPMNYRNDSSYVSETKSNDQSYRKIEIDDTNYQMRLDLIFSNTPSAKKFFWEAGLTARRQKVYRDSILEEKVYNKNNKLESGEDDFDYEIYGKDNYMQFALGYNFGYEALASQNARVLVGSQFSMATYLYKDINDKINKSKEKRFIGGANAIPTIYAEYAFSKNWLVFGRARHDISLIKFSNHEFLQHYDDKFDKQLDKYNDIAVNSGVTNIKTGLTFKYKKLLMDAAIASNIYRNPFSAMKNKDLWYYLGAALFF